MPVYARLIIQATFYYAWSRHPIKFHSPSNKQWSRSRISARSKFPWFLYQFILIVIACFLFLFFFFHLLLWIDRNIFLSKIILFHKNEIKNINISTVFSFRGKWYEIEVLVTFRVLMFERIRKLRIFII